MRYIVIFALTVFSQKTTAQNCWIRVSSGSMSSYTTSYTYPIQFTIKLKDTTLISSPDGILEIPENFLKKNFKREVIEFRFYKDLDEANYRTPMFTRTKRTLGEYCGQDLVAANRHYGE